GNTGSICILVFASAEGNCIPDVDYVVPLRRVWRVCFFLRGSRGGGRRALADECAPGGRSCPTRKNVFNRPALKTHRSRTVVKQTIASSPVMWSGRRRSVTPILYCHG